MPSALLAPLPTNPAPLAVWPAVRMVARTHTGLLRTNNEDAVSLHPLASPWPMAVLADGMGGYSAGEVASAMAVSLIPAAMQQSEGEDEPVIAVQQDLTQALLLANAAIHSASQTTPGCQGMGTTVVAAAVLPDRVLFAHLGDSRAYAWREGQLIRVTRDHSLLQREIDAGNINEQEARSSGLGHLVTRALGVAGDVEPELTQWMLQPKDRIMLCSDGITDMLSDESLATLFAEETQLPLLLTTLVEAANAAGGKDNISVVLMELADCFCQDFMTDVA